MRIKLRESGNEPLWAARLGLETRSRSSLSIVGGLVLPMRHGSRSSNVPAATTDIVYALWSFM